MRQLPRDFRDPVRLGAQRAAARGLRCCRATGFWLVLSAFQDTGLSPAANIWSASIAALLGYVGFRVVVVLMCAL